MRCHIAKRKKITIICNSIDKSQNALLNRSQMKENILYGSIYIFQIQVTLFDDVRVLGGHGGFLGDWSCFVLFFIWVLVTWVCSLCKN